MCEMLQDRDTGDETAAAHRDPYDEAREAAETLARVCHGLARRSGWWDRSPEMQRLIALAEAHGLMAPMQALLNLQTVTRLMLIVSELGEAMEGHRKSRQDEHLPEFRSLEVELADAAIRIFDMAGGEGLRVPQALGRKLAYNQKRADHRPENRAKAGGKAY